MLARAEFIPRNRLQEQTWKLYQAAEQEKTRLLAEVRTLREYVSATQQECERLADEVYDLRCKLAVAQGQEPLPLGDF